MNERIQFWWQTAKTSFQGLGSRTKIGLGVGAGVLVLSGLAASQMFKDDPYQILYSDLQSEDSRAVTKKLSEKNIPHQVTDESRTVLVPKSQVHQVDKPS